MTRLTLGRVLRLTLGRVLRPLYRLYEIQLVREINRRPIPCHIGIILDGNRREAQKVGITEPVEVYRAGADRLDALLAWCAELRIPAVTIWVCSTENLKRREDVVAGIFHAIETKLKRLVEDPQIHRRKVRVSAIGSPDLIPSSTLDAIRAAEAATSTYDGMRLTIAVAYGGRQEITDAVRSHLTQAAKSGRTLADVACALTPDEIGSHLYLAGLPDPDLIIRTSGEVRLSGFLLWQSAYSEFYFCDVTWPAFRKVDLLRAIRSFQHRARRFGR